MAPTKLFTANQTKLPAPSDLLKTQLNIESDRVTLHFVDFTTFIER